MATADRNDFIELIADGFDLEREMLYVSDVAIHFIKRSGRTVPYVLKYTISSGFKVTATKTRGRLEFEIASLSDVGQMAIESSNISWLGTVYLIGDGDIVEPSDDRLTWIIYGNITGDKFSPV